MDCLYEACDELETKEEVSADQVGADKKGSAVDREVPGKLLELGVTNGDGEGVIGIDDERAVDDDGMGTPIEEEPELPELDGLADIVDAVGTIGTVEVAEDDNPAEEVIPLGKVEENPTEDDAGPE
ncbi:hypothetical protein PVAG01_06222 [Phlyctema vagabunda]|uniref:Uncharacterized protein n=1 Tax=Phlyctema vagabunda TaxID=108571 RepID=A0ABR4PFF9_9HELO